VTEGPEVHLSCRRKFHKLHKIQKNHKKDENQKHNNIEKNISLALGRNHKTFLFREHESLCHRSYRKNKGWFNNSWITWNQL